MLILAIDTSAVASAALVSDAVPESVLACFSTEDTRSHAEVLAPGIEDMLAEAGVAGKDIDALVVGVGPGPFTGLRSGIATARTLALSGASRCTGWSASTPLPWKWRNPPRPSPSSWW